MPNLPRNYYSTLRRTYWYVSSQPRTNTPVTTTAITPNLPASYHCHSRPAALQPHIQRSAITTCSRGSCPTQYCSTNATTGRIQHNNLAYKSTPLFGLHTPVTPAPRQCTIPVTALESCVQPSVSALAITHSVANTCIHAYSLLLTHAHGVTQSLRGHSSPDRLTSRSSFTITPEPPPVAPQPQFQTASHGPAHQPTTTAPNDR